VSDRIPTVDRFVSDPDNEAMFRQAAARVIQWRREHGAMSQVQFASRAGISVGALQSFESGTRATRKKQVERIAAALDLTLDQLLADDAEAGQTPNPLLKDLLQEDLRLAQRFHHAGAETKHAVKKFLVTPMSEEKRERIALMLADLVRLDESQIAIVETILTPLNKDGRPPAANAPTLEVVAPPSKKKG
jgi:transcriptional regulator with XRE-family HTH domain